MEIGKLLPGNYTLKGEYKGEYGHLKSEETLDFSKAEENIDEHDIDLKGAYVNIESNIENATVFINGEDTKITVLDAKDFGPFRNIWISGDPCRSKITKKGNEVRYRHG